MRLRALTAAIGAAVFAVLLVSTSLVGTVAEAKPRKPERGAAPTAPAPTGGSTAPAPSPSGSGPALAHVPYNDQRPLLAYYYAWWGTDSFRRTLYTPEQPYNSDDVSVMRRHMQQAQAAGVDGFVLSWYGHGDRTDRNLATLLELGKQSGVRSTIHFETPHFAPYGVRDVVAQLKAFYAHRITHPSIVTYQGRPVIFFWRASTFDNATWDRIRAEVDPERRAIWLADGDQFGILAGDAWDGISPYAIAWSAIPATHLASWASRARSVAPHKLWVPPVSPGCDDTAARAPTCIQGRADGAYYQATIDGALATNPAMIIVSTFNEWLESTQIEPSREYGDLYLQMTRQLAGAFKGFQTAASLEPAAATAADSPFVHGFALLHQHLGAAMGLPLEPEWANPENGDTMQQTTTGLAFYRKSTNTPTFTDGWRHWAWTIRGLIYWEGDSIDPPR